MDKLECPVCMCLFEEPVSLLCGHSVCLECGLAEKRNGKETRENVIFSKRSFNDSQNSRSRSVFNLFRKVSGKISEESSALCSRETASRW